MLDSNLERKESGLLDFKERFDASSGGDWCELIKDIAAMANSGGGTILVGVNDDGTPSEFDVVDILKIDQADILNRISSYTDEHFNGVSLGSMILDGKTIAKLTVSSTDYPIVFKKPGTYPIANGKQRTAFSVGSIYFRHGSKSEPCRALDIREFVEGKVGSIKGFWLEGIRQVVEAPEGAKVIVHEVSSPAEMRFSDDPTAPATRLEEKEIVQLYPLDYLELVRFLRSRYSDFVENNNFHQIKRGVESDTNYCYTRYLNPRNNKGSKKTLYSLNIVNVFDKHYTLRR